MVLYSLIFHTSIAEAGAGVVNPRLTTDSSLDTSSAADVVRQIVKPGMGDEEKVLACWRFMLDHFYHWHPPQEESVPEDVRDFAKAINSYGYGPCFVNAPVLCALWESAGFETRVWNLGGHTVPEVRYNGAWHMLDGDARGWHRGADGQIGSVTELSANPALFLLATGKSDPYYPFAHPDVVSAPLKPWSQPSRMMDLFSSVKDNKILNHRAVTGHPMVLTLRPGESLTLAADHQQGLWNRSGRWYRSPRVATEDPGALQSGPLNASGRSGYGNGELHWRPDLTRTRTLADLWLGTDNVQAGKQGLRSKQSRREGVAVFRVWSPYAMVGGRIGIQSGTDGFQIPQLELSTDGGHEWTPLAADKVSNRTDGRGQGELDVSGQVVGKYEYLLRVHLDKIPLAAAEFTTTFQLAPLSLPKLRTGANRITVFQGPPEGVVPLVLGPRPVEAGPDQERRSGIMVSERVEPEKGGGAGSVIYKLVAPSTLTALAVGGNLTLGPDPEQFVESSYSLDQGKNWQPVWRQSNESNSDDFEFEIDKRVALANPNRLREVMVKFSLQRNSPFCSLNGIRLYGFYHERQTEPTRLGVEMIWQEKHGEVWQEKKMSEEVRRFPQDFWMVGGGEEIRLTRITMTP